MIYALDTNAISLIVNGNAGAIKKLNDALNTGNTVTIPLMTYYEARRGLVANNATRKLQEFDRLCGNLGVDDLTTADMDTASQIYADLKKKGMLIEDSDLIIAAFCKTHGYILITDNVRHFERVGGLKFENWID